MEGEVSGIAKLGIVLIALAVLIGLGFGIFQISKSTANTGVGNVQSELDSVSQSAFTTYDQKTITGTMASSAVSDFEGETVAVIIATQAWVNLTSDVAGEDEIENSDLSSFYAQGAGINSSYMAVDTEGETSTSSKTQLPVILAYGSSDLDGALKYEMSATNGSVHGSFINYNAILGVADVANDAEATGISSMKCTINGSEVSMAAIYFDSNCFRCTSGFASDKSGKILFNNIASNISKTGRTEYIPSGAKFTSYIIKDASGTNMGIAIQQVSGN